MGGKITTTYLYGRRLESEDFVLGPFRVSVQIDQYVNAVVEDDLSRVPRMQAYQADMSIFPW